MEGETRSPHTLVGKPTISVVIPVHNEVDNVLDLTRELVSVLETVPNSWEICFVNDGSTDGTEEKLNQIAGSFPNTTVIHLTRRFGQSAALQAGFEHTHGEIVVTLDGDLQNDPRDIPRLLNKLNEGYDVIHGWRKNRQDRWLSRRVPSLLANWLIRHVTGVKVPDLGCGIRAMRRWVVDHLDLLGDMHRYLPILVDNLGAKSTVLVVNHRSRQFGKSKYGLGRMFRVLCDIPVILWLTRFYWTPMRAFAFLGVLNSILIAAVFAFSVLTEKSVLSGVGLFGFFAVVAAVLGGITILAFGLMAELLVRVPTDRCPAYVIRYQVGQEDNCLTLQLSKSTGPTGGNQTIIRLTGT